MELTSPALERQLALVTGFQWMEYVEVMMCGFFLDPSYLDHSLWEKPAARYTDIQAASEEEIPPARDLANGVLGKPMVSSSQGFRCLQRWLTARRQPEGLQARITKLSHPQTPDPLNG